MTENDNNKPNKYHNGKIYTIRCRDDDSLIYVGSSCLPLHKRFYIHKQKMKEEKQQKRLIYIKMNELGMDKFYIELYELYKCDTKEELVKREGEVIRQVGTLNKNIAGRTDKQYYNDNIEKLKQYREDNKEKIAEQRKKYWKDNKDKITKYKQAYYEVPENQKNKKLYDKDYANKNKEKLTAYKKEYYKKYNQIPQIKEKNKLKKQTQEIKDYYKEKIMCECGCSIRRGDISKHNKTKKHYKLLNQFNNTSNDVEVIQ